MYKLDKLAYLACVLRTNPSELWHLIGVGLNTFTCRYVRRCVGRGTVVGRRTMIVNSANVQIGDHCLLQDGVYIRAGADGRIKIKDRVALNSFCRLFGHGGITIGEDTQIGPGSLITTTAHDYDRDLESRFEEVTIGKGVWIGANVTVLPGVTIGDFAVIGAGSLVTKDVQPHVLAAGVPAHEIRRLHEGSKRGPVRKMAAHDSRGSSVT
jgi:acetyltransferase-like isoleucine patch superfamily enzyme